MQDLALRFIPMSVGIRRFDFEAVVSFGELWQVDAVLSLRKDVPLFVATGMPERKADILAVQGRERGKV